MEQHQMPMNPKLKVGALILVAIGAATVFQFQRLKVKQLMLENAAVRTQLAQMVGLQETNELLATRLQAALAASQANERDLMRLRGREVRLRQLEEENTQLKAAHRQPELQELESQLAGTDHAAATNIAMRVLVVKTAVVDFYTKHGSLPDVTNFLEPTLLSEGLLDESTPNSSNVRTRVVQTSDPAAPVTAANQAYSLDGFGTNIVFGRFVVEAVIGNITASGARELSLVLDGPQMTNPLGQADLAGRVKFDAIPLGGVGEVHVYMTHR